MGLLSRLVAVRTAAAMLVAAVVLAACGEPTSTTPSPEAIETAESIAREVVIEAPVEPTPDPDTDPEEPIALDGRVFGTGDIGVILAHMRPSDQTSWFPFATDLARTGDYTVLTFDFRGFGESTGDKQFDRIVTDLDAAYDYMRSELDVSEIFLVGASMGGTASLVLAAQEETSGIVSISSPAQFQEVDALESIPGISEPKLFISSEDDIPAMRSLEEMWELARSPKEQQIYQGDEHGTNIFDSANAGAFASRIIGFIREHSAATASSLP